MPGTRIERSLSKLDFYQTKNSGIKNSKLEEKGTYTEAFLNHFSFLVPVEDLYSVQGAE